MMRKVLLLLLPAYTLLLHTEFAFSQNDEKSLVIGNASDNERSISICADAAGNSYLGGESNNRGLVVKQNALHINQWSKTLRFTANPADEVEIGFLDVIGDTVFGCGKIHQSGTTGIGSFYFKMNALTGVLYWSKYEVSGDNYLSCMRYANGRYYLVGGTYGSISNYFGKVMAVSSQTGQVIWQSPKIKGFFTTAANGFRTVFMSCTEMVNGKLFITGHTTQSGIDTEPILVGINENGTVFLQKHLDLPVVSNTFGDYTGVKIEYDSNQDLILAVNNNVFVNSTWTLYSFLIKCDSQGNIIFAKQYTQPVNYVTYITHINETPTSYVIYGLYVSMTPPSFHSLYVMRVSKTGAFEKLVSIKKPNVNYYPAMSFDFMMGNSTFINGQHYFPSVESSSSLFGTDINQIILNEELDLIEDCSVLTEKTAVAIDVPVTVLQMGITNVNSSLTFSNGIVIEDYPLGEFCDSVSLDLVQTSACSQLALQANHAGFIDPTFYWSTGDTTLVNSLSVNTTDTLFLRVVDTKCCELLDTIVPVLIPSSFMMNLPSDTSVCLQPGNSFTIAPAFSGANGAVTYLWSNNSTGTSLNITQSGTYWVQLSDSCSIQGDSIVVTVNFLPVIGSTANVNVCEEDFPVVLSPAVSAGASVLWDDGTLTSNRTVTGPGSYTVSATNSCGTTSEVITVIQTDLPTVQLIASVDTCINNGSSVALIPAFTGSPAILWSDGSTGNQLAVPVSGNYTVYASNSCGVDSASCSVTINYFPELDLPLTLDTCFEAGVGFSYTAQGSPGSYQWSSGSQTGTEWISQEGMYGLTLTNQCGSITDSMQVRRLTEVDLYFPADSLLECEKQLSVSNLQIETNYILEIFAPDGSLTGTHLTQSGWYSVHAFNSCGEKWDSIYVNLQNEQYFYLPNSFTPNGDQHNDRFEFKGENITIRDVRIFNRWGEEIFTENGNFTGWDGTSRGETCPDGVYAVHLIYEDCFGLPTEFKGHLNLIR